MQRFKLKNGLIVLYEKKKGQSVAVEVCINVGAVDENDKISGISHFLEHILFEGTKTRTARQISSEIENLGGEFNAATDVERTYYYAVLLNKHFEKAVEILSDMMFNSTFKEKAIKKEKGVIVEEITTTNDNPMNYQWIAFQDKLYDSSNLRRATYGTKRTVKALTRKIIMDYHRKHYVPGNMVVSIVGDVKNAKKIVEKYFGKVKFGKSVKKNIAKEQVSYKRNEIVVNKRIDNSYVIVGFKGPDRKNKDSYSIDIINAILGKGQSGRLFNDFRLKEGLAYVVGSSSEANKFSNYIAAYVSTAKKKVEKCKKMLVEEFKLKDLKKEEIEEAKQYIEGSLLIKMEDVAERADVNTYWTIMGSDVKKYIRNIKKVNMADVKRVMKKYFNKPTIIILKEK
jgi:predicted Zn-dependent peptidase